MKRPPLAFLAMAALLVVATARGQGMALPEFERIELDNGAIILLHEKHDVPLIGVEVIIRGGASNDPEGLAGLSGLLAGLLEKGAGDRDAAEFAESVAAVGGELSASGALEAITISGEFLADDADLLVELLADMLRRPALDAAEMDKLRKRLINFIRAAKDSRLGRLVPIYGNAFLFGDHPYGNPASGSEESLGKIKHRDLLGYYRDYIGADRLIIAVAGDFDSAAMKKNLTSAFGDWRKAPAALIEVTAPIPRTGRRVLLVDKPGATQTYFWIANVGVAIDYPRRAELDIANTVFGGRFTSMLNTELRIKSGLTYGARSTLTRPAQPGSVAIYSYTKTDSTVAAIDMALGVLSDLRATGIDAEMIQSAKNYILGQFPPRLETASQLAGILTQLEHMNLDVSYIDDYGAAVADADSEIIATVINDVYPALDDLVFVLLGDAELIREAVTKYGPVTEMSITAPRFRP